MTSTHASPTPAIRAGTVVRLVATAGAGWFVAGRLRGLASPARNLSQSPQLALWGGATVCVAVMAASGLFELLARLPRTPLHPPAGPGWPAGRRRRFVLSWLVVAAIAAMPFFIAAIAVIVYVLAPSLAGGRALLAGVDAATKLCFVAGAGALVGSGFFVVSLPSLLADLSEIARKGNS